MMSLQFYVLCALLYGVHHLTVNGQTVDFQGPGFFTCSAEEYDLQPCSTIDIDRNVCSTEALESCNFTTVVPAFDDSLTTIIIPLVCECVVALECPEFCSFTMGEAPTSPPIVSATSSFFGPGYVTCLYVDYFNAADTCSPSVLDNNLTLCGTCDPTILDQTFGYMTGDTSISIPLPCECLVMTNCPDTCTFTAASITAAPTPAVTNDDTPDISFPTIDMSDTPMAGPTTTDVAPSPLQQPTEAPVTVNTAPSPIKLPTNTSNTPTTSSAYDSNGQYSQLRIITLMMFIITTSSLLLFLQ